MISSRRLIPFLQCLALTTGLNLFQAVSTSNAQEIVLGPATGQQGSSPLPFPVSLNNEGLDVGRMVLVIHFEGANIHVAKTSLNLPDCFVNPAINRPRTRFRFRPQSCGGSSCSAVEANIKPSASRDAIPDASILFTCNIVIPADASAGNYPVVVDRIVGRSSKGKRLRGMMGLQGEVDVVPSVSVSSVAAPPGTDTNVAVTLSHAGTTVVAFQSDLWFDRWNASVPPTSMGKPTCTVSTAIAKYDTQFAFRPPGCSGSTCAGVRALVLSMSDLDPLPNAAVLYTCTIHIPSSATPATYPLILDGVEAVTNSTNIGPQYVPLAPVITWGQVDVTSP